MKLSDREIAQLVAALRNWQLDGINEDLRPAFYEQYDGSDAEPLNDSEIDDLCDRLSFENRIDYSRR